MSDSYIRTISAMGTIVTVQVVGHDADEPAREEREDGVARALEWFTYITEQCSRFDPASELSRLVKQVGVAVSVSTLLFQAVRFALAVADDTNGAFDPTIGHQMEARGFDVDFRSGEHIASPVEAVVSYRDVWLDADAQTITLAGPLVLDLGAVVKGLAIDTAARELAPFTNFAIDAGGDLYLAGSNARGDPWSVGIRHPRSGNELIETLRVSNTAICTSGDYERRSPLDPADHHIIDARTGVTATASASVTVLAPTAMVADALATAAFVLGPVEGLALLDRHGVEGLIVTPSLECHRTHAMRRA